MARKYSLALTVFVCLIIGSCVNTYGQTVTGTLSGNVVDTTNAVVPGIKIIAKNIETGFSREVITNQEGYFNMPFLQLGSYEVTAEGSGFQKTIKTSVTIELNKTTISNFKLDVARVGAAVVEITGETAQIELTTGEIKHSLDVRTIENTPLAGRNFVSLLEQIPGFQVSSFGGTADSGQNNPTNSSGSYASFNGLGSRTTSFQIDGVNNDDSSENQNRQGVNVSTIKEVQVIQNAFSAEFGRGGAAVLVQTKSGTNKLHGDLYDYLQNDILNANGFFRNQSRDAATGKLLQPREAVRRHNYGGTIGGPIYLPKRLFGPASIDGRDRLFFYVSADRLFNKVTNSYTRVMFLPGEEPKACAIGPDGEAIQAKAGDPLKNFCLEPKRHPNMARDLEFLRFVQSLYRTPELEGVKPNNEKACADLIGSGRENRCVTLPIITMQPRSDYSGRLDFKATNNDNITFRYQYSRQIDNTGRFILGDTFGARNDRQYNLGLTATHVFSNRQIGEFRYGFGNRATLQDVSDGNHIPTIRFNQNLCTGSGVGACGGVIGTSTNVPINRRQRDHQLVYNHTLTFSRHTLKVGVDQRFQALDDVSGDRSRGFWTFGSDQTAPVIRAKNGFTSFENFMRGYITGFQKGFGNPQSENRFGETNFYLQEDLRLRPNLTLNLGARYEYVKAPKEIKDRFIYGFDDDKNNFQPRIGFAYSPTFDTGFLQSITGGAGKTVIRGGYGINHSRLFQSVFSQNQLSIRTQPPNGYATSSFFPYEVSDPTNGFVFTPGVAPISTPFTTLSKDKVAVKDIGGRMGSTLLVPAKNLGVPYVQQWNLTVERQLAGDYAIQLNYSGNRGIGSPWYDSANDSIFPFVSPSLLVDVGGGNFKPVVFDRACTDFPATDPICQRATPTGDSGSLKTFAALNSNASTLAEKGIVIVDGVPHGYISLSTPRINERRPDPTLGRYVNLQNFGWSYYHGFTAKLSKRFSKGYRFTAFYTFSKAIDTGSEATFTTVDTNQVASKKGGAAASLRGLSAYHSSHRFVATYAYEFPFFKSQKGLLNSAFGGWTLTGTTTLQSGNPFSVALGYDLNGDGLGGDRPVILNTSILGTSVDNGRNNPAGTQFSTNQLPGYAFNPNQAGSIGADKRIYSPGGGFDGTVGRNVFFMHGINNTDATISKRFSLTEGVKFDFRLEFYNVFNRVTFGAPSRTILAGPTLGTISNVRNISDYVNSGRLSNGSRQGQIALRLIF